MTARNPNEGPNRPSVGDILMVVHDFHARSSDELSLKKGDRVELLERDDEFGDGWFLGRQIVNNNSGLFPEVYTRPAPKQASNPSAALVASQPLAPLVEVVHELNIVGNADAPLPQRPQSMRPPRTPSEQGDPPASLNLNSARSGSTSHTAFSSRTSPSPTSGAMHPNQDNQVLSETLNVINEHITHLRSSPSASALQTSATDSSSEYSATLDHRMSYIQGEETDEEEDGSHTRAEVEAWSPDQVAEYLLASGVEKHHCEVFKDQEISGEVILSMDQGSLFIKALDLGSVGRRLKTWHKIKSLQDEISGHGMVTRRTTQIYSSDAGSDGARRTRSRTSSTLASSVSKRPSSVQNRRMSMTQSSKPSHNPFTSSATPSISSVYQDSPARPHMSRPSAASVREMNHFRRHSSTDYRMPGSAVPSTSTSKVQTSPVGDAPHKKQPSFDRNWTLGEACSQPAQRPLSSAGQNGKLLPPSDPDLQDSAVDMDRGYFSGIEVDGTRRSVLKKRDSANKQKKQSYTEEQRLRSATALSRHSRYGSFDSYRDGVAANPTIQKYYGVQQSSHRRTASTNTTDSARPLPPAKDGPPPTVTKLDTVLSPIAMEASPITTKHAFNADWLTSALPRPGFKAARPGMRAISDKLTFDRSKISPSSEISSNDPSMTPLTRTGSSTASGTVSLELDPSEVAKSPLSATAPISKSSRKKGKKATSAYTRGLLQVSPKEAMKDADYYGWMRKKSSNLMTTWKPRLFVLKGRRLAYYYSENDDSEKGLIDISFHRVLPADNDKLTGLHATITGAVVGPGIPANQTLSAGGPDAETLGKGDEATFIFKLVPPRAGLSKAVNFTKPTVHYFAVPNLKQGRLWMAALMKASIERDDTQPITTTYQQKTISLAKAKQMRSRPPALMNLDEATEEEKNLDGARDAKDVLNEADSGVSGIDKVALKIETNPAAAVKA